MFRIDNATAVPSLPAPQAAGTPGYFTRGDPSTGAPPTVVTADWANMFQEELMAVILAASLSPDKTNHAQLLAALNVLFLGAGAITGNIAVKGHLALPLGLILQWGVTAVGSGANVVTATDTFDIAFPTAAFTIFGNADGPANGGWHPIVVLFDALSTTGFTVTADSANSGQSINAGRSVRWAAIGH